MVHRSILGGGGGGGGTVLLRIMINKDWNTQTKGWSEPNLLREHTILYVSNLIFYKPNNRGLLWARIVIICMHPVSMVANFRKLKQGTIKMLEIYGWFVVLLWTKVHAVITQGCQVSLYSSESRRK